MPESVCSICGGHPSLSHVGPGLTINRNPGGSGLNSEMRIYTTVAKDRIVEEGDLAAAFLVATPGSDVPPEYVELYQEYRKGKAAPTAVAEPEPEAKDPAPELEAKAVEGPPENKARGRADAK